MAYLDRLATLNLSENEDKLTGSIPAELSKLANLKHFYLNSNMLTGGIPTELSNLTQLHRLHLDDNDLTGAIPVELGNLTNLQWIYLNSNMLTGGIPTELSNLTQLHRLHLDDNDLTGAIPVELGELTSLHWLYLNDNMLTGAIPRALGSISTLTDLLIAGNTGLTGCIPHDLPELRKKDYDTLGIQRCDDPAAQIAILTTLYNTTGGTTWTNSANWLNNKHAFSEWHGISTDARGRVTGLNLSSNALMGTIPADLGDLDHLQTLKLNTNQLTGSIDDKLRDLADTLSIIHLAGNSNLTGCIPFALTTVADNDLNTLAIPNCDDPIARHKKALIALYTSAGGADWTRRANWNTDAPLADWDGVTTDHRSRVIALDLSSNNFIGTLPADLGNLDYLQTLKLNSNQLTGDVPAELHTLSSTLTLLHLADNPNLTGCIPYSLLNTPSDEHGLLLHTHTNRQALTTLYNLTDGANWTNKDGWLTDVPLADWHGVTANPAGDVTALDLSSNGLSGEIPIFELASLHAIQTLRLNDNALTGMVLDELGSLADTLTTLMLDGNSLTGCIPYTLRDVQTKDYPASDGSLPICGDPNSAEHAVLVAFYNATNGQIWTNKGGKGGISQTADTGWLSRAQINQWHGVSTNNAGSVIALELGSNAMSGDLPTELATLTSLQTLDLNDNQLTGSIPTELATLTSLQTLDLNTNQLTGAIPASLGRLPDLQKLSINDNQLTGDIPQQLGDLGDTLNTLHLNGFTSCIPYDLWDVQTNTSRRLAYPDAATLTHSDRQVLATFYQHTQGSRWADNTGWLITKPLSEWFGVTTDNDGNVTRLILIDNNLGGTLPSELGSLIKLERFQIPENYLTGSVPTELSKLTKLELIQLNDNSLTGSIPLELSSLENLQRIVFGSNNLTGSIPPELGNLPELQRLNIGDNKLTGEIPTELGNLTQLTSLSLHENDLVGSIPASLSETSLTGIELFENRLSGSIPPELGKLNIRTLGLRNNHLSGSIPDSFGNFRELLALNLSHNELTGAIPASLGNLANVEALLLNSNKLSGNIPLELGNLAPTLKRLTLRRQRL